MLRDYAKFLLNSLLQHIESFCECRNWEIKSVFLVLFVALFLSFPSYDVFEDKDYIKTHWKPVLIKIENPFADLTTIYSPGSHASKLNLRLTVPIIARYLHLGIYEIIFLQFLFGIGLFFATVKLTYKITQDRITSFIASLTIGSIFPGITSFVELRGIFDGIAISLLIFSLLIQNPIWIWFCLFLSFWTDERAIIASSLVWLFHTFTNKLVNKFHFTTLFRIQSISVIIAWATYAISRYLVSIYFNLHTPTGGVGLHILLDQVNNAPMGIWTGLEGGWVLVLFAIISLILQRSYIWLLLFIVFSSSIIILALSVVDITRSMAYILPAFFFALRILSLTEKIEDVRKYVLLSCLISILWPNYYAGGKHSIWWNYPLPIQLIRWFFKT